MLTLLRFKCRKRMAPPSGFERSLTVASSTDCPAREQRLRFSLLRDREGKGCESISTKLTKDFSVRSPLPSRFASSMCISCIIVATASRSGSASAWPTALSFEECPVTKGIGRGTMALEWHARKYFFVGDCSLLCRAAGPLLRQGGATDFEMGGSGARLPGLSSRSLKRKFPTGCLRGLLAACKFGSDIVLLAMPPNPGSSFSVKVLVAWFGSAWAQVFPASTTCGFQEAPTTWQAEPFWLSGSTRRTSTPPPRTRPRARQVWAAPPP